MAEAARAAITTILFTDLVDSTALMQRMPRMAAPTEKLRQQLKR